MQILLFSFLLLSISQQSWSQAKPMQVATNYPAIDSLFCEFMITKSYEADSLPLFSLSPSQFVAHIDTVHLQELTLVKDFARQTTLDSTSIQLLVAKITYKNVLALLLHPIANGFFEVQGDENFDETAKTFYRESYKDYSLFLDTLEINNDFYLQVPEYVDFISAYLDYQEQRFWVFNKKENCQPADRQWLAWFLLTGEVRKLFVE